MIENNPVAVRVYALQEAVKSNEGATAEAILEAASRFMDFLNGSGYVADANVEEDAKPEPAKAAKAAKPAKPAKVSKPTPEPEVAEPAGPTKEEVGNAVQAMLSANLRDPAIKLMEKYKAKSVSTLDPTHYAAFLKAANEILLAA